MGSSRRPGKGGLRSLTAGLATIQSRRWLRPPGYEKWLPRLQTPCGGAELPPAALWELSGADAEREPLLGYLGQLVVEAALARAQLQVAVLWSAV